jgi:hypothetical protein
MNTKNVTNLIFLMCCTLLPAITLQAQPAPVRTASVKPIRHSIGSAGSVFNIRLSGGPWALGVEPAPAASVSALIVGLGQVNGRSPLSPVSLMENAKVETSSNGLTVLGETSARSAVAVHLRIRPGVEVAVWSKGREVFRAVVGGALVVQDGSVVESTAASPQQVNLSAIRAAQGIVPVSASPAGSDVQQLPNGGYIARFATAKKHLRSWNAPSVRVTDMPSGSYLGTVEILVGADGGIASVTARPQSHKAVIEMIGPIRSWSFKPFKSNGSAVPVTILLPFTVSGEKEAQSPLHPGVETW